MSQEVTRPNRRDYVGAVVLAILSFTASLATKRSPWATWTLFVLGSGASVVWLYGKGRLRRSVSASVSLVSAAILLYMAVGNAADDEAASKHPGMAAPTVAPTAVRGGLKSCGTVQGVDGRTTVGTGWGPDRQLFTIDKPADHPTLNSITNNSVYGDERAFFSVKPNSNVNAGGWCNGVHAADGEVLLFRIYVANSAADSLGDKGAAKNVRLSVFFSDRPASLQSATAYLTSDNTTPLQIYSSVEATADKPFRLDVISHSLKVYSNAPEDNGQKGRKIDEVAAFSSPGVLLGFGKDDGVIAPPYAAALYITFAARVTFVG